MLLITFKICYLDPHTRDTTYLNDRAWKKQPGTYLEFHTCCLAFIVLTVTVNSTSEEKVSQVLENINTVNYNNVLGMVFLLVQ